MNVLNKEVPTVICWLVILAELLFCAGILAAIIS